MKKRLLFVIDSLEAAGAEKSLVTLLSLIDYDKYDVDLQLFSYGGEFEDFIPDAVRLLPPIKYFERVSKSLFAHFATFRLKSLFSRLRYSLSIRKDGLRHADRARLLWKCSQNSINSEIKQDYDIAIAYAHNLPTFYVAEKIKAKKKLAWVNVNLHLDEENRIFQEKYYVKFDNIVAVSDSAYAQFAEIFPNYKRNLCVIYDIIDSNFINRLAKIDKASEIKSNLFNILTVARLNFPQKGYDIALEACKILRDRGCEFRWYALGKGKDRINIEKYVHENGLDDIFILLGTKTNPYPYFKACDIYVQTSRHEGFGLSIAEARILNKPVVTTEFDAVWNQMVQGKNGSVVPLDAVAVADAIEDLLKHPEKREAISAYQRTEKKGNTEELEKFYQLING